MEELFGKSKARELVPVLPDVDAPRDKDGIVIPPLYRTELARVKWERYPIEYRRRREAEDAMFTAATKPKEKQHRPAAKRYTTDYAIEWGRKQGWKDLDRERYDFRLRRHHDLVLGSDAMMESPDGIVFIQGAGRSERKEHRTRFESRGGVAKAQALHARFVYLEFERGDKAPKVLEWWA